jgi:hypothetical protein
MGLESLRRGAGLLAEGALDVGRDLLELRLDEVGVRRRVLAVEHPGADLHRVLDQLDGAAAGLLALAHQPHRGLVVEQQPVDGDPVAGRAHGGLA